jgi:hypothetical protein
MEVDRRLHGQETPERPELFRSGSRIFMLARLEQMFYD